MFCGLHMHTVHAHKHTHTQIHGAHKVALAFFKLTAGSLWSTISPVPDGLPGESKGHLSNLGMPFTQIFEPQICIHATFLPCFVKTKLPLSDGVLVILSSPTLAFVSASLSGTPNPCHLASYADPSETRSYPSNLLLTMRSAAVVHQPGWS